MSSIDELVAEAELGEEARLFLDGNLGQCLVGIALQQVQLAQEALEIVDPSNTEQVRKLQNDARLGRQFSQWLLDLLRSGEQAMEVYKSQKDQ